jgi:Tfp pilus assembly protein PilO
MPGGPKLALIVSLLVIAAVVLVGVLGYLMEKNAEAAESKHEGKAR